VPPSTVGSFRKQWLRAQKNTFLKTDADVFFFRRSIIESEYQRHKHGRKSLADRRAVGWGISSAGLFPTDKYFKPHLKFIRPYILLRMFKVVRKLCAMAPLLQDALEEDKGQENITFRPNADDTLELTPEELPVGHRDRDGTLPVVHYIISLPVSKIPVPRFIKAWIRTQFTLQI
jgi:hypothetical protein